MTHLHDETMTPLCRLQSLPLANAEGVCMACDAIWWAELRATWATIARDSGADVGTVWAWVIGERPYLQDGDMLPSDNTAPNMLK